MKIITSLFFATFAYLTTCFAAPTNYDIYDIQLRLSVPRIYDNNQSLGYRKNQTQTISGKMLIWYDANSGILEDVTFQGFTNKTHKLANGSKLTYPDTKLDLSVFPRFNAIGNNKTKKFTTASIIFGIAAEPSYNIGEFDEDNALYLCLSGSGRIQSKGNRKILVSASGKAAGTLGCGCSAYGHISPTRTIGYYGPSNDVDDVAAVYGVWSIRLRKSN